MVIVLIKHVSVPILTMAPLVNKVNLFLSNMIIELNFDVRFTLWELILAMVGAIFVGLIVSLILKFFWDSCCGRSGSEEDSPKKDKYHTLTF